MDKTYDFLELMNEIKGLDYFQQQKRLIIARTEYLQNVDPIKREILGVPFDVKCNLELQKIEELEKLDRELSGNQNIKDRL